MFVKRYQLVKSTFNFLFKHPFSYSKRINIFQNKKKSQIDQKQLQHQFGSQLQGRQSVSETSSQYTDIQNYQKLQNEMIDVHSDNITEKEIQNFDIYYGMPEFIQAREKLGNQKKILEKTIISYDIPLILEQKLQSDYSRILFFLQKRGASLKIKEVIYCLHKIMMKPEYQEKFVNQDQASFKLVIEVMKGIKIYEIDDFLQIIHICIQMNIEDESVWLSITSKASVAFKDDDEEVQTSKLFQMLKMLQQHKFKSILAESNMIKIIKKIVNKVSHLQLEESIQLLALIMQSNYKLEFNQCKKFDEIFKEQTSILTFQNYCQILQAYSAFNFQKSEILEVVNNIFVQCISTIAINDNKDDSEAESNITSLDKNKLFQMNLENYAQFIQAIAQINYFKESSQTWYHAEQLFLKFVKENDLLLNKKLLQQAVSSEQVNAIIFGFNYMKKGSKDFWLTLSGTFSRNIELELEENFLILKNLTIQSTFSPEQLNLTLSFLIQFEQQEEETTLKDNIPKSITKTNFEQVNFQYLHGLEPSHMLYAYKVYTLNIYNNIIESTKKQDISFMKNCLSQLSQEISWYLVKGHRLFKQLSQFEILQLYNLFQVAMSITNVNIQEEVFHLQRKILREIKEFRSIDYVKLYLILEKFNVFTNNNINNQQQQQQEQMSDLKFQQKINRFFEEHVAKAIEGEICMLCSYFFKYDLKSPFIWALLQVKFIDHMELLQSKDLIMIMSIFTQKIKIEDEIWDLFIDILQINTNQYVIEDITYLNNLIQEQYKQQHKKISLIIQKIIQDPNYKKENRQLNNQEQLNEAKNNEQLNAIVNRIIEWPFNQTIKQSKINAVDAKALQEIIQLNSLFPHI